MGKRRPGTRSLCAPNACVSPHALHAQVHSLNPVLPVPAGERACTDLQASPASGPQAHAPHPLLHHQPVPRLQQPLPRRHHLKVTVTSQGKSSCCSSGLCAGFGLVGVWTPISSNSGSGLRGRPPCPPRSWEVLFPDAPSCCKGLCVLMTPQLFLHSAAGGTPPAALQASLAHVSGTAPQLGPCPTGPSIPSLFLSLIPPPGGPVSEALWTCRRGDRRQPSQRLSPEQLPELEAL